MLETDDDVQGLEMDTKPLTEDKLVSKTDPFCQFDSWLKDATQIDHHFALNACLATGAQDGTISNRVVTMGSFNKDGFVFFTSAEGRKAKELESNPNCALTFYWPALWRQVRIEGTANLLPDERSEEHFRKLPFQNQIVLNNARQSEAKCRDEMERAMSADSAKPVPKPSFLKGYQITPTWIEFNQAQENFLSDRLVFTRPASAGDKWELQHLAAY